MSRASLRFLLHLHTLALAGCGAKPRVEEPPRSTLERDVQQPMAEEANEPLRLDRQTAAVIRRLERLHQQGDYERGVQLAEATLAESPEAPLVHYLLGVLEGSRGNHAAARTQFETELRRAPRHLGSLLGIAAAYANLGDQASTLPFLRQAAELGPQDATVQLRLGRSLAALGRMEEAATVLETALALRRDSDTLYEVGDLHFRRTDFEVAERLFREALWRNASHEAAMYGLGQTLIRSGREEQGRMALAHYAKLAELQRQFSGATKIARIHPDSATAARDLAVVQIARGNMSVAAQSLRRALRLAPDQAESAFLLVSVLLAEGQLVEADSWASFAVSEAPEDWRSHYWLGRTHLRMGRPTEAQQALRTSADLRSWPVKARTDLAAAYRSSGHCDLANETLANTENGKFEDVKVWFERSLIALCLGDRADASRWIAKALALESDHGESLMLRAILSFVAGRREEADATFLAAADARWISFLGRGAEQEWLREFDTIPGSTAALRRYRELRRDALEGGRR